MCSCRKRLYSCLMAILGRIGLSVLCFRVFLHLQNGLSARYLTAKGLLFGILLAILAPVFCFANSRTSETWFIDFIKYHVSAHGRLSCQDCHPDMSDKKIHPNPSDVTLNLEHFFHPELCFNCHDKDSIKAAFSKGFHGGKPIEKGYNYDKCIVCHDPHYQPGLKRKSTSNLESGSKKQEFCAGCHAKKDSPPAVKADDVKCMQCHEAPAAANKTSELNVNRLCLACHGRNATSIDQSVVVPRIDEMKHCSKGHKSLDCLSCHADAASFAHNRQMTVQCSHCHTPHDEATLHDTHSRISCQDCHLSGVKLRLDPITKRIVWQKAGKASGISSVNVIMLAHGTTSCLRCHKKGNHLGAVAMVLPAKSVICMPCHAATFTFGDPVTLVALLGFLLGILSIASVWLSGKAQSKIDKSGFRGSIGKSALFARVLAGIKGLFLDGLLQRRLFHRSHSRWFVHSLIFWPFVIRFSWGFVALLGSMFWPKSPYVWEMLNKNNALTAILFDLTGLSVLLGIILSVLLKRVNKNNLSGLPESDWPAMFLLASIIIIGFILEGARIALTGVADINHFAFIGLVLSLVWSGVGNLSEIYGYIWYLHAALTAIFVIYLPFSRMLHIIMAPIVAALNSIDAEHSGRF